MKKNIKIGKKIIGDDQPVYIVAELSANHNHNLDIALLTIKAMKKAGADAVKIQAYKPESLSIDVNNKYFGRMKSGLWKGKTRWEIYKQGATPYEWQIQFKKLADRLSMELFSSAFDFDAADHLEKIDVPCYKIASFEINDIPLIRYVAQKGKPIIMSTGVAEKQDIEMAVKTCKEVGNHKIVLLKCTSDYPASFKKANLLTILDMRKRFHTLVGVSDHSPGASIPTVAVAYGACVVEKHFVLDRKIGGPDADFSMLPEEFAQMVKAVREAEKVNGKITYKVSKKDKLRRRSLFAVADIKKGEVFSKENIRSLRPGHGLAPKYLDNIFGKKSKANIKKGIPLKLEDIK